MGKSILLTLLLPLCLPGVVAAQKLMAGYSAVSAISAPFWVMKDAGFFKQEGLDADGPSDAGRGGLFHRFVGTLTTSAQDRRAHFALKNAPRNVPCL